MCCGIRVRKERGAVSVWPLSEAVAERLLRSRELGGHTELPLQCLRESRGRIHGVRVKPEETRPHLFGTQ